MSAVSCTAAPQETVELSEIVGEQVAAVQRSHEAFVRRYYAELREDVDVFLREVWIPSFLAKVAENPQVREDLLRAQELADLDPDALMGELQGIGEETRIVIRDALGEVRDEGRADQMAVMMNVAEAAERQIQLQREEMMQPLFEQEARVLDELRAIYADLQRGQAALEGYLASVVELKREEDLVLEKLGILEQRDAALEQMRAASDAASRLLSAVPAEGEASAEGVLSQVLALLQDSVND